MKKINEDYIMYQNMEEALGNKDISGFILHTYNFNTIEKA